MRKVGAKHQLESVGRSGDFVIGKALKMISDSFGDDLAGSRPAAWVVDEAKRSGQADKPNRPPKACRPRFRQTYPRPRCL